MRPKLIAKFSSERRLRISSSLMFLSEKRLRLQFEHYAIFDNFFYERRDIFSQLCVSSLNPASKQTDVALKSMLYIIQ